MIVYIEYVLINNFLVTLMLLLSAFTILKENKNKIRIFLSCIFGATMAIVYPLCNLDGMLLLLLKMLVGFLICTIAYKTKTIKKLFVFYILFIFLTAIYGGINMMIYFAVYGDFSYSQTLPMPLILFSVFIISYFVKQTYLVLYQKKQKAQFIYNLEIIDNNKKLVADAYLDSGNVLCDPQTNQPILVINYKVFNKLYKDFSPIKLLNKDVGELKNAHYIKVSTVTANGEMLVFSVDNIILKLSYGEKVLTSPMLGLTKNNFKHLSCDILLNPKIF